MRKLASIQRIAEVKAIKDADLIEAYRVNDWWVVDSKGKYQVDDKVVYCEVDSWVPTEIAPFLSKGKEPREYNGVKGERLRTVRLRGQLSQGLLLPLNVLDHVESELIEGLDVSYPLNIQKWEPVLPACLAGQARSTFPSEVPKTDQERIQNLKDFNQLLNQHTWEVTEKLHGSSSTFYLDADSDFHVCSRNLDLKFDEHNAYWKAALMYDVEQKMRAHNLEGYAIQGELIGEGINGNQYKTTLDFYVFDVFDVYLAKYLKAEQRVKLCHDLGLKHVPCLHEQYVAKMGDTKDTLLAYAEGKSMLNGSEREGLVFKSTQNPDVSFKVVSNRWLLKTGE